jgi:16S rRNA (adenine1518-N6/adenine1519-N6)-dimethyltransferase
MGLLVTTGDHGPQGRARIRELLTSHELSPRKPLGQHFLTEPNVIRKIVRLAAVGPGSSVVEIGGGTGTLTAGLADSGARVVVYEIDPGLVGVLEEVVGDRPNVEIRHADAVGLDLDDELDGDRWVFVANLPYNVGTGILLDALRGAPRIERFVVMVQREVADRLFATAGSKRYGIPSVTVGLFAEGGPRFTVGRDLFYPKPRVASTVLTLDRITPSPMAAEAVELAATLFRQRRKMLRRSLAVDDAEAVLREAGIDPTSRPEDLAPADFVALTAAMRR